MSEEELRKYYEMFTDAWRLFRKCLCLSGTDDEWDAAIKECNLLVKKHGSSELAKKLLIDIGLIGAGNENRTNKKES